MRAAAAAAQGAISRRPLTRWRAVDPKAAVSNVIVIGDSVTEGTGATALTTRYATKLGGLLQAARNAPGVTGGLGWINTHSNPGLAGPYWAYGGTGTTSASNTGGWIANHQMSTNADATATATFTGTGAIFPYVSGNSGWKAFTYSVDGGAAVTVTPASTGPTIAYLSITGLAHGSHTITFTPTATYYLGVRGMIVLDGDENAGVHLIEAGHFGWKAIDYQSSVEQALSVATVSYVQPTLVVIFLGLNDLTAQTVPSTYQAALQSVVTQINANVTTKPSYLFCAPYNRTDATYATYPLSQYVSACAQAALATPDSRFLDLRKVITGSALLADAVHPNDTGHQLIAEAIAKMVL